VAIAGGRIVEIGEELHGVEEIDASGAVVSPGFVDIHTHYDAQVFWDPSLTPSSFHGVTSVVAGNCGFSIAPVRPDGVEMLARTLQHVEDMSYDTLAAGVPWDRFETFPQYLDAVRGNGTSLNFGCYVGHTAVRLYVMGAEAYERSATVAELSQMQAVVADAMAGGAIGFASSANPVHFGVGGRPVPSRLGDFEELRTLLAPVRDAGRGVVALLPGRAIPQDDLFALQREIGRPFTWTALLTNQDPNYHRGVVAAHDAARADGVDVWPQISCRPLVFQMNLLEPFTFNSRPSFSALMDAPITARKSAYADPAWRARAWEEMGTSAALRPNWLAMWVAESPTRPDLIGKGVTDLATEQGVTPLDIVLDLSLADDLRTRFNITLANSDLEGIAWLLPRDGLLLGLADSGAHVSQLCDACFATDLLGRWVRDREVLSLERAIRKLSGEPAAVYGLDDRGTLEVGKAADVCVFDPDTVGPGPTRRICDFPANGERLTADAPSGVRHVMVNGVSILRDGAPDPEGLAVRPGVRLQG
jgi:N-acyl-D-amino-acid deacylase